MSVTPQVFESSQELRLACTALRDRLRAGESVRVEDLLARHPDLAASDEAVYELIHTEFSTRHDLGERPTLEEWEGRLPALLRRTEDLDALRRSFGSEMPTLSDAPSAAGAAEVGPARGADGRLPRVGNYQLIQEIGRGGMGVVYKARQSSLSRIVALKMILAGEHAGLRDRARLRNEAEAAAQLLHPNVVQIFEIGEHEGLPFLTMEYVAGGNLMRMLRGMPQAFRWTARLAETLARTIHVAHQQGIIHRDINPSNILMTAEGTPKISDFGLAKFLLDDAGVSLNGVILGTPSYMAPEQVSGHCDGVGPAADVYALGALMYEMLTGTAPFRGLTPMETLCQVVEAEVVPPSRLRHGVPDDLETICLKCLEKEPGLRYASALDLADDLRRFQENQPIQARRISPARQAVQWARRQPLAAGLLGLTAVLLSALFTLGFGYLVTISKLNAELKQQVAQNFTLEAVGAIAKKQKSGVRDSGERFRYDHELSLARKCLESGEIELAREIFEQVEVEDGLGFEWRYLDRLLRGASRRLDGHEDPVTHLAVARRSGLAASGDRSGRIILRDLVRGDSRTCPERHASAVKRLAIAWSARTRKATTVSLSEHADGSLDLRLWDASTGGMYPPIRTEPIRDLDLAFSPDGNRVSLLGTSGSPPRGLRRQWRLGPSGWRVDPPDPPPAVVQAFSDDARWQALAGDDGTVWVEDEAGTKLPDLDRRGGAQVLSLAFNPDGMKLVAGRKDGSLTIWDVPTRRVLVHESDHRGPVVFVGFTGDSSSLLGCDDSRTVWMERLGRPGARLVLQDGKEEVVSLDRSPDGRLLAVATRNRPVRIYELASGGLLRTYLPTAAVPQQIAFAADGKALLIGCNDSSIRAWRFGETGDDPLVLEGHSSGIRALAFSQDGTLLASGSEDHTIRIWDRESGRERRTLTGHDQAVTGLAFLADGRLASTGRDGRILLWDLGPGPSGEITGRPDELHHGQEDFQALCAPAIPGFDTLAVAGEDGTIQVWDLVRRTLKRPLVGHGGRVEAVAYGYNPAILASVSSDHTVRMWNGDFGLQLNDKPFEGPMTVAFSADGERFAASGENRKVAIWSTSLAEDELMLSPHPMTVRSLVFCPSGRTIATGCDDGKIRLWDVLTGIQLYALPGHGDRINALAFSADGSVLASADRSGQIRLWRANEPVVRRGTAAANPRVSVHVGR